MSEPTFSSLYYDTKDPDMPRILRENLGLTDPTPTDHKITKTDWADPQNQTAVDFYTQGPLTVEEKKLMRRFTSSHPLTQASFSNIPGLSLIAIKEIRYHHYHDLIDQYGLPREIDVSALDFATPTTTTVFDPTPWFHDTTSLENPTYYDVTHPAWHAAWSGTDWIYATALGGHVGLVTPRSAPMPKTLLSANTTSPTENNLLPTQLDFRYEARWPEEKTKIDLLAAAGINTYGLTEFNLETDPGATITVTEFVRDQNLISSSGQPLLELSGFHLNWDAGKTVGDIGEKIDQKLPWIKLLAQKVGAELGLPDFDLETLSPTAIVVMDHRLYLTLTGEKNHDDILKPVGPDVLLIDISGIIKSFLSETFFDNENNIRDVPLRDLQSALLLILEETSQVAVSESITHTLEQTPWEKIQHDVSIQNIQMNLMPLVPGALEKSGTQGNSKLSYHITDFKITDGKVRGEGQIQNGFIVQGQLDTELALESTHITAKKSETIKPKIEFFIDTQVGAGYARLKLPDFAIKDVASFVDGTYGGEVLIGLSPQVLAVVKNGEFSTDDLLSAIAFDILVNLHKNQNQNFLVAAFHAQILSKNLPDTLKVHELLTDYNIAFSEGPNKLYGVINGGKFSMIDQRDSNNILLARQFDLSAQSVVTGGLVTLFGQEATLSVLACPDGSFIIKPAFRHGKMRDKSLIEGNHFSGELHIIPSQYGGNGEILAYTVQVVNLAVDIPKAEIHLTPDESIVGRTRGVVNGEWIVTGSSLLDVINTNENWQGRGTLSLVNTHNDFTSVDGDGNQVHFDNSKIASTLEIALIQFNPMRVNGSLFNLIEEGGFRFENDLFRVKTDVKGSIEIVGEYPLVSFRTEASLKKSKLPQIRPIKQVLRRNVNINDHLDSVFDPIYDEMQAAPPLTQTLHEIKFSSASANAAARAVINTDLKIDDLALLPGAAATKIKIPIFRKFWKFLNPNVKVDEDTDADITVKIDNNTLRYFSATLDQSISFLGFNITGIEYTQDGHCYILTKKTRLDVLCLLHWRYPAKMARFDQNMKKRFGVEKNEIPTKLDDLVSYLDALDDVLGFKETMGQLISGNKKSHKGESPKLIDVNELNSLTLDADLKPLKADFGLLQIREDNIDTVSLKVAYHPHERPDSPDDTPYLQVDFANEDGEAIEGLSTNLVTHRVLFKSDLDSLSGVHVRLDGPLSEAENDFMFSAEGFSGKEMTIVNLPRRYKRPVFALSTKSAEYSELDSQFTGHGLFVNRQDMSYDAGVTFDDALVHGGYIYFIDDNPGTGEKKDFFLNHTDVHYQDFTIGAHVSSVSQDDSIDYNFDTITVKGDLYIPEDNSGRPRAYMYIGQDEQGRAEYTVLERLSGDGFVDVTNGDISYNGNIKLTAAIPPQLLEQPVIQKFKDKGITLDVDEIRVEGSMSFALKGSQGGLSRLDPKTPEFQPTALTLVGNFSFETSDGTEIHVSNLTIPINTLMLQLMKKQNGEKTEITSSIIERLEIPEGENIHAQFSTQVRLPQNLGSGVVGLKDAQLNVTSTQKMVFTMVSSQEYSFAAQNISGKITDPEYANTVDLAAQTIAMNSGVGHIKTWQMTGQFSELLTEAIATIMLSGKDLTFELKNES